MTGEGFTITRVVSEPRRLSAVLAYLWERPCAGLPSIKRKSYVVPFPFLTFQRELERRSRETFAALAGPNDDVEATLFRGGAREALALLASVSLQGLDERGKASLALDFTWTIQAAGAIKAGLLLPTYHPRGECLCLLLAASGRCESVLAEVRRRPRRRPLLAPWSEATARVEGLFADALLAGVGRPCPACGTGVGGIHAHGCDVERCSACGDQHIICDCADHNPSESTWSGEWPGLAECRARGWYARRAVVGWEPCAVEAEGAREDLNRLAYFREFGFDGLYQSGQLPR